MVMLLAALAPAAAAPAAEPGGPEGALHGFPVLLDPSGKKLADGDFTQSVQDGERLRVQLTYAFPDGRRIEETSEFRQKPELAQERWSWRETRGGAVLRRFQIDFAAGRATGEKREEAQVQSWSEKVEIEPGRTFAGFGFVLAIKNIRPRLLAGAHVELKTIAFTPKPRPVSVEVSHAGLDEMRMGGRAVRGDRFLIRPKIPRIAKLFINVPDSHLWLVNPPPAGFLRMEGLLLEPDDPVVRIDLQGGGESGPAKPVAAK